MTENRIFFSYARHALVAALRVVGVQKGDRVLVPEFICRDVLAPLLSLQVKPMYYRVGIDLQAEGSPDSLLGSAMIAVNYFGFPADLEKVQSLLANKQTPVIEDNAHGWLSRDTDGRYLGTRTSVGVTSFRKTIRVPNGAFVTWSNDLSITEMPFPNSPEPDSTTLSLAFRVRNCLAQSDSRWSHHCLTTARFATRGFRWIRTGSAVKGSDEDEFVLPSNLAIHRQSLTAFHLLDRESEVKRRQAQFRNCLELASEFGVRTPFTTLSQGVAPQGFPFFKDEVTWSRFIKQVRVRRLGEVMSWPTLPQNTTLPETSVLRSLHLVNFLR